MVINHLLTGMILQVNPAFFEGNTIFDVFEGVFGRVVHQCAKKTDCFEQVKCWKNKGWL